MQKDTIKSSAEGLRCAQSTECGCTNHPGARLYIYNVGARIIYIYNVAARTIPSKHAILYCTRPLTHLDTQLELVNPGASEQLALHGFPDLAEAAWLLTNTLPSIISIPFNAGASSTILAAGARSAPPRQATS